VFCDRRCGGATTGEGIIRGFAPHVVGSTIAIRIGSAERQSVPAPKAG
jgi:hypothetical protein